MKTAKAKGLTKQAVLKAFAGNSANGLLQSRRVGRTIELLSLKDSDIVTLDTVKTWIENSPRNTGTVLNVNQTSLSDADFRKIAKMLGEKKEKDPAKRNSK